MTYVTETDFPAWLRDAAGLLGHGVLPLRGERLRLWGLSEVWRLELAGMGPRSVVVKRGTGEMAEEAARYRDLVAPLRVPAPRLIAARGGGGTEPVVLVLEDAGQHTLEQRPTAGGYREAVRTLARMRAVAARELASLPALGAGSRRTTADFADTARVTGAALARLRPDLAGALDGPARVLAGRLELLAADPGAHPATLVHSDFHAKNLVLGTGGRVVPVDWPLAYVHAHLGDLYCLLREARNHGRAQQVEVASLPGVFAEEAGADPASVREQLVIGGLCWTLLALRWVVEDGVRVVPESARWIDELVSDARSLAGTPGSVGAMG
ncbi:phosphotransferase [Streptomyces sp. NPDC088725]|uniref:phosphotransferase n=1 Tax=Streptomyces sp. NPDC088725 TaxID=3365873 RepID=UPI00381C0956